MDKIYKNILPLNLWENHIVRLNLPGKRHHNTPFWYLCQKAIQTNIEDMNLLIGICMEKNPIFDVANIADNTVRSMIMDRGSKELKEIILGDN